MEVSAIIMGQRVRAARQAKKMKTEELAEKVNIAVESIGHIECGARKPSLNLLFNIAEVLEVSLDYLTGRTPTTNEAIIHACAVTWSQRSGRWVTQDTASGAKLGRR